MSLTIKKRGDITIVKLPKSMEDAIGDECRGLKQTIKRMTEEGERNIIINLRELRTCTSALVGTLVALLTTSLGAGGNLILCEVKGHTFKKIFEATHLDSILKAYDTLDEAVNAFSQKPTTT
jgi:anti-sigma B factor antagonist